LVESEGNYRNQIAYCSGCWYHSFWLCQWKTKHWLLVIITKETPYTLNGTFS
jgi:hypothetical protein